MKAFFIRLNVTVCHALLVRPVFFSFFVIKRRARFCSWSIPPCRGSFIYFQGCCVALGALLHKGGEERGDGGAVIVTTGCRITSLEQLVIRVAGM